MLALTLHHPWSYAIIRLGKTVENRGWSPGSQLAVGEWFAIHGGVIPASRPKLRAAMGNAMALRQKFAPEDTSLVPWQSYCPTGIVAIVRYSGCVTESPSPWFEGPFGWTWNDIFVLPVPIQCKGAQGLWKVSDAICDRIREEWRASRKRSVEV